MKQLFVLLSCICMLQCLNVANTQWTQNCTLLGLDNCQMCQTTYFANTAICSQCASGFGCKPSSSSAYQSGPYSSGYGGSSQYGGYNNMGGGACDCIPCDVNCLRCNMCMPYDMSCPVGGTKCSQCATGYYPNAQGNCINSTTTPFIFTREQINKIIAKHGK